MQVIDTCIQSNPKTSALVWGGLKLVIQVSLRIQDWQHYLIAYLLPKLASEFTQFFDRILRMVERITKAFPDFETYHSLYSGNPRLHQTLVHIYIDILAFWGQISNIFLKRGKDGTCTNNFCYPPILKARD